MRKDTGTHSAGHRYGEKAAAEGASPGTKYTSTLTSDVQPPDCGRSVSVVSVASCPWCLL